jgi:hypothetical protein
VVNQSLRSGGPAFAVKSAPEAAALSGPCDALALANEQPQRRATQWLKAPARYSPARFVPPKFLDQFELGSFYQFRCCDRLRKRGRIGGAAAIDARPTWPSARCRC